MLLLGSIEIDYEMHNFDCSFLGFYTNSLIVPTITGLFVFFFGLGTSSLDTPSREICDPHGIGLIYIQPLRHSHGVVVRTHDLHAVSCGFKVQKSQWWWQEEHLMLIRSLVSLLSKEQTPWPRRTGNYHMEYKRKQSKRFHRFRIPTLNLGGPPIELPSLWCTQTESLLIKHPRKRMHD